MIQIRNDLPCLTYEVGNCDYEQKLKTLLKCLRQSIRRSMLKVSNPSAVFDIDDTLITNGQANSQIVRLYEFCRRKGIHLHIVTARSENIRRNTVQLLSDNGINHYESLVMMRGHALDCKRAVSEFKHAARASIQKKSNIVVNVGDTWTDLTQYPFHPSVRQTVGELEKASPYLTYISRWPCLKLRWSAERLERERHFKQSRNHGTL